VIDITGTLAWWKATLRQLDAELVIAQENEDIRASRLAPLRTQPPTGPCGDNDD
jgi:hypothetical protein